MEVMSMIYGHDGRCNPLLFMGFGSEQEGTRGERRGRRNMESAKRCVAGRKEKILRRKENLFAWSGCFVYNGNWLQKF